MQESMPLVRHRSRSQLFCRIVMAMMGAGSPTAFSWRQWRRNHSTRNFKSHENQIEMVRGKSCQRLFAIANRPTAKPICCNVKDKWQHRFQLPEFVIVRRECHLLKYRV
jgi:hypothetical protein